MPRRPDSVENLERTMHHFAVREQRLAALRERLSQLCEPGEAFVWEIGCGHGHFLVEYARALPARQCIGIDIMGERIDRAIRKRDRARLANLHFLRAEARLFLEALPAGVAIGSVFILFPDPWPKLRHHKHRIMQREFLAQVASRAAAGGCRLHFRTDHREYFESTAALLSDHADWQPVDEPWPFEFETVFQSKSAGFHSLIARRRP